MSLPRYPDTFPAPERTGISGSINVGLRRTSVPVALANQVKDFNAPRVEMLYTFAMTNDQVILWLDWLFESIKWGWFVMDVVSPFTPRDIVSSHTVRVMGPLDYQKQGDNWATITTPLEIVQNDPQDPFIPEVEYDWIYAGFPNNAAPDWIIAGTPDNPSLPVIISHLYYRKQTNG